jgi:hypothetical protein
VQNAFGAIPAPPIRQSLVCGNRPGFRPPTRACLERRRSSKAPEGEP